MQDPSTTSQVLYNTSHIPVLLARIGAAAAEFERLHDDNRDAYHSSPRLARVWSDPFTEVGATCTTAHARTHASHMHMHRLAHVLVGSVQRSVHNCTCQCESCGSDYSGPPHLLSLMALA